MRAAEDTIGLGQMEEVIEVANDELALIEEYYGRFMFTYLLTYSLLIITILKYIIRRYLFVILYSTTLIF